MERRSSDGKYGEDWARVFTYDASSPSGLIWAVDRERGGKLGMYVFIHRGDAVGSLQDGYWSVRTNAFTQAYTPYMVHRIIWELHNGPLSEGDEIDHKDGNPSNNAITNLRKVTGGVNCRNQRKRKTNNTGITGVSYTFTGRNNYFQAFWNTLEGEQRKKSFNIDKLGIMVAFRNACQYREAQINRLNSQGAGYSDSHGV
jgi:hypothetical protein